MVFSSLVTTSKLPVRGFLLLKLRLASSFLHPFSQPPVLAPVSHPLPSCPHSALCPRPPVAAVPRVFSSSSHLSEGPVAIDYSSVLKEEDFHRLADEMIEGLQERLEEYGDEVQLDGLDIDYGNQVLTVKLGTLGTYVINKQTPNRQIWLSSPVSGPSRFDWDGMSRTWVYRRTKANLLQLLQDELEVLCGKSIKLC